ncbi:zinc-binding protein A33-like [Pristis pectinata]|uniref:zinc-binding protein A33-like n=1 Tax=Pristis pectinata TaxID=685728 RepID=UPI00223D192F|nr:zinc-binding protein A33-like [Pristis pectinata]
MAESLDQNLRCGVCARIYSEPVTLDCGHNFCRPCVLGLWGNLEDTVSCPQCGQQFPRRELKTNQLLATLVTSLGVLSLEPSPVVSGQRCQSHWAEPMLFCSKNLMLVCPSCLARDPDKRKSLMPPEEAYTFCQEKLENSAAFLEKRLEEYRLAESSQGARISETLELADNLQENIETQFAKMHQLLSEQEMKLRDRLTEESQGLVQALEGNLKLVSKRTASVQKLIAEIRSLTDTEDRDRLLTEIKNILQRSDLHQEPVLQLPGMSVGEFRGPLQYAAWKQMLSIVSPAPAPLTLDPETASPCLMLSKDHTMVKRRTKLRQVPESGRRFAFCAAALTTEGFASGTHYWEVDVETSAGWIVGAARETAERSEEVPLTPANGYWTVRLWNDKVHWCRDRLASAHSCADAKPQRVGVYLDYEAGQLSFYDAGDMSHLCTFFDHFAEKIYPFVFPLSGLEPAETEVLRLFHLRL